MNLIVDLGNTSVKLAVFNTEGMVEKWTCTPEDLVEHTHSVFNAFPNIKYGLVAAVGELPKAIRKLLYARVELIELSHTTKVPFSNLYESPTTLGVDRIGLIAAACQLYPSQPVLVIDAGSCVTYDFKDRNEQYHGGAIAPGLNMRYKAVNQFTAKLPNLQPKKPEDFIGNNTEESLHVGIVSGLILEIDGFIDAYREKFPELITIFTGGDLDFLRDSLKNDIFANPNFLLEGLNYILEHNKN